MKRILWLATADARGHLMRAQILVKELQKVGIEVTLLTTSIEGQRFFEHFGLQSEVLSLHYSVQFDSRHNMDRDETNRNISRYFFDPARLSKDLYRLWRKSKKFDLIINDSLHPALLVGGWTPLRKKIVHLHGENLRDSLLNHFAGRGLRLFHPVFKFATSKQISLSKGEIRHTLDSRKVACSKTSDQVQYLYPVIRPPETNTDENSGDRVVAYFNPHFKDERIAQWIEEGVAMAGKKLHGVSESFAHRKGWVSYDDDLSSKIASSCAYISGLGMASLSQARFYRIPFLGILANQPEQVKNLGFLSRFSTPYSVIDIRNSADHDIRTQIKEFIELQSTHGRKSNESSVIRDCLEIQENWVKAIERHLIKESPCISAAH